MSVKDGFIEVTNFKGQYVYGSVATYHCNPGYILWGNASRLCVQDGAWTGTQPQCKTISCGQPPEVANAHYRLANGTSTTWLSLAVYFCQPGHRMVHHQHGELKKKRMCKKTNSVERRYTTNLFFGRQKQHTPDHGYVLRPGYLAARQL